MAENKAARAWVFTWNIKNEGDVPEFDELYMKYLKFQREIAPTTGQHHWQGIVRFINPCKLPQAKRMMDCTHIHMEICRDWMRAKDYVEKKDTAVEGSMREYGKDEGQGARSDLKKMTTMILEGAQLQDVAREDPTLWVKYHRGFTSLKAITSPPVAQERNVICLIGLTGVGKTRFVMDNYPNVYNVFDLRSPWFDGYDGEETVLLDECGPGMMNVNILKQLTDRYAFRVPCKGGSIPWAAKNIFLTSNDFLHDWYPGLGANHLDALKRRIKVFYLPQQFDELYAYTGKKKPDEGPQAGPAALTATAPSVYQIDEEDEPEVIAEQQRLRTFVWDGELDDLLE